VFAIHLNIGDVVLEDGGDVDLRAAASVYADRREHASGWMMGIG
jgi:hypothetical protein